MVKNCLFFGDVEPIFNVMAIFRYRAQFLLIAIEPNCGFFGSPEDELLGGQVS